MSTTYVGRIDATEVRERSVVVQTTSGPEGSRERTGNLVVRVGDLEVVLTSEQAAWFGTALVKYAPVAASKEI